MVGLLASYLGAVPRRQGGALRLRLAKALQQAAEPSILSRQMQAQAELAAVSYSLREHRVLATQVAYSWVRAPLQMVREGPCG